MTTDNIAGHTAAQNTLGEDGLRDGDSLSPATLTNLIQGVQGNGILRYQDGAYGSTRNETNSGNQPASMVRASSSTLTVSGGFVVLDGALYEFGGGVGNTITLDLNDGSHGAGALQLSANEEAIYTIYVAPSGGNSKVHYEGGSPVDTTTGLYPSASNQYLIDYDTGATQDNMKAVVLAHVRVQFVSTGGGANNLNITEINDKRVFVNGAADYRVPLSVGTITSGEIADGGAEGINTIAHLNAVHNENGELSTSDTVNAHWVSHPRYGAFAQTPPSASDAGYGQGPSRGADRGGSHAADSFYFAGRNNEQTGHYSVRLQGRGVDATSTALTTNGTWVLTAEGDSFLMLSPNSGVTITLNPERDGSANYKFPEGHIVEVCNDGAGDIVFDNQTSPSGLNATLSSGHRATFIYEGTVWVRCDYQSAIIANAPAIEISGGAPAFATGITQAEMLTLLGVEAGATADQTDAEIRAAVEAATDSNVFTDADHTKLNGIATGAEVNVNADWNAVSGDAQILNKPSDVTDLSTHSVTELNDVTNAGSGAIITSAERTKLGGIETAATADQDADEVPVAATPSNYTAATADVEAHLAGIDTALASAGGGGTPSGVAGAVQFSDGAAFASDDANLHWDDANNRLGIGTNAPDADLHVESAATGNIFVLECTDGGTNSGPDISMIRDSSSPASGDFLGRLVFKGRDSGGNLHEYGNIKAQLGDPTNGAEDFNMFFQGIVAGNNRSFLGLRGYGGLAGTGQAEVCVNENSIDMDFRVESDNKTSALFVRGSDGNVGIGTTAPAQELHVAGGIRQTDVTSAVLVANANGDLVAASNLSDQAYSTTDTTDAAADAYSPAVGGHWSGPVPATTADALDRLAAWIDSYVITYGPTLTPPLTTRP
jgi:hypothetical protein